MTQKLALLSRYGELILYKTYADLRAETERTYLGFLWWIFEPIMYMSVFYIIFGLLLQRGTADFVPFLLVGLTVWQWFKSCLSHGAETILGASHLMRQIYLPKVIFPLVLLLTDTVKFIFIFVLLLIFLWFYGYNIGLSYIALPIMFTVQLLFTAAFTFLLAAIVPFVPDLRFVVENLLMAIFFMSGIFLPASAVPEAYRFFYYLNPIVSLIEGYRDILMYSTWPNWFALLIISAFSILLIGLAVRVISHFEYVYPKIMR